MPYVNIPKSNLVPNVASILGRLEGNILTNVNSTLQSIQRDLERGILSCEGTSTRRLDNLSQQIGKVKRILSRFKPLTRVLRRVARSLSRILRVLKKLPIPGLSLTAGITTTFSDLLHLVKEFSAQLEEDADGIDSLISNNNATQFVDTLEQKLENLKTLVDLNCRFEEIQDTIDDIDAESPEDFNELDEEDIENFKDIVSRAAPKSNISSEVLQLQQILSKYGGVIEQAGLREQDPFSTLQETFTGPDGRQYLLKIITLSPTFTLATQRQAIAQDVNTREVLFSGSPSFASNPDILIEELKFKINTSV